MGDYCIQNATEELENKLSKFGWSARAAKHAVEGLKQIAMTADQAAFRLAKKEGIPHSHALIKVWEKLDKRLEEKGA